MLGFLIDKNGVEYTLPPLLSWDIFHSVGDECDSFEVSVVYSAELLDHLASAVRFRANEGSEQVFYGVVDEYRVSINEKGCIATVYGRSLKALLLDNESVDREYTSLELSELIDEFVTPLGITLIERGTVPQLTEFSVKMGESVWSVLKRFCLSSAGIRPRFSASGVLLLTGEEGRTVSINADTAAFEILHSRKRRGILSKVYVKNQVTHATYTVNNQSFIDAGGCCSKAVGVPQITTSVGARRTGEYMISESYYGKNFAVISVPELFKCRPADKIRLTGTVLGITGLFPVVSTRCRADADGAGTEITIEL